MAGRATRSNINDAWAAAVIVPVLGTALLVGLTVTPAMGIVGGALLFVAVVMYGLPISVAFVTLVGLPVHALLCRRGWVGAQSYLIAGLLWIALAGAGAWLIDRLLFDPGDDSGMSYLWSWLALEALIAGGVFWIVRRPDRA